LYFCKSAKGALALPVKKKKKTKKERKKQKEGQHPCPYAKSNS
jgi:hypothetical protein